MHAHAGRSFFGLFVICRFAYAGDVFLPLADHVSRLRPPRGFCVIREQAHNQPDRGFMMLDMGLRAGGDWLERKVATMRQWGFTRRLNVTCASWELDNATPARTFHAL